MPTVPETLAECPYLRHFMTGGPYDYLKDAEVFKCSALQARAHLTAEGSPSFVEAVCLRDCGVPELEKQGLDPMLDPFFAHLVHSCRRRRIHHGFNYPECFDRADFLDVLVAEVKTRGGREQAREDVLEAIRNGLGPMEGQRLISEVVEEVS